MLQNTIIYLLLLPQKRKRGHFKPTFFLVEFHLPPFSRKHVIPLINNRFQKRFHVIFFTVLPIKTCFGNHFFGQNSPLNKISG